MSDDGKLYELLDDEVDIGASKWWWPESDRIEVRINSLPGKDQAGNFRFHG